MGRLYIVFCKGGGKCKHFDKESAEGAVSRIYYTTKDGTEHHGPNWSMEQVLEATKGLQFKPCVTDYDKYVAFNAAYADLATTSRFSTTPGASPCSIPASSSTTSTSRSRRA